jgi:hypothetical protein
MEKVGPVKNPLTIIAIFAAIVEVSSIYVLPSINSNLQFIYIWFLMLFPTLLVISFFVVLWFKHYVLYAPSDYKDDKSFIGFFDKDFEENKILDITKSVVDSVTNAVKENVRNTENNLTTAKDMAERNAEEAATKVSEILSDKLEDYIHSNANMNKQRNYGIDAYAFERRILNILSDLGIPSELSGKGSCMDIIATKKDGKIIPIEIKYYQAPLRGSSLVKGLIDQIKTCMSKLGAEESILIISSSVSFSAMSLLNEPLSKGTLYLVTGNTEEKLIPQLKNIFELHY